MNILFCSEYFYPRKAGGEVWAYQLCKALVKKGHKVTVITSHQPNTKQEETLDGIVIKRIASTASLANLPGRLLFSKKMYAFLKQEVDKNKYDVIHAMSFIANIAATKIAKRRGIPSITSVHSFFGNDWFLFENFIAATIKRTIEKRVLLMDTADLIHIPSLELKQKLDFIETDKKIVPNFIQKEDLKPLTSKQKNNLRKKIKSGENDTLYISIGSLTKLKRIHEVVRTINLDKNERYIIIGDGPLKNAIKNIIKARKLEKKIQVLQTNSHKETMDYLQVSDCLINPSVTESFGLVILEALYANKNILSTKVGILKEIKHKNIHTFSDINKINIVKQKLKKPPLVATTYPKEFVKEVVVAEFENIYSSLLNKIKKR